MELSFEQRLRNAIYQVKFSQMPGTHANGEYVRELTVNEALNKVAKLMGITAKDPKPLYFTEITFSSVDTLEGKLYSRVTSRWYDLIVYEDVVEVKYQGEWYECATERAAMNFINSKELEEPPTTQAIKDGHFEYYE